MSEFVTVWKYPLQLTDVQRLTMPGGAKALYVAEQFGQLCLWALVNPNALKETRTFAIVGTGNPAPVDGEYVGSVVSAGGALVWHIFGAPA